MQISIIFKNVLVYPHKQEGKTKGMVNATPYQNVKFKVQGSGLGPRIGPLWPLVKNVLILRKYFSLLYKGKNLMHGFDAVAPLYQNFEIHGPMVKNSGPRVGPIWLLLIYVKSFINLRLCSHIYLRKIK